MDKERSKTYDRIRWEETRFSGDSNRFAFIAENHNRGSVVVDNMIEGIWYDRIASPLFFSPDSKRLAYYAMKGSSCVLVVDGQEYPATLGDASGPFSFSPDSKHFAYCYISWPDQRVRLNGAVIENDKPTWGFSFASDGKLLYLVRTMHKHSSDWEIVLANRRLKGNAGSLEPTAWLYSPDGMHVVYTDGRGALCHDGQPFHVGGKMSKGIYSSDSSTYALLLARGHGHAIVSNGREWGKYDRIADPSHHGIAGSVFAFSADNRRCACIAYADGGWRIVENGISGKGYSGSPPEKSGWARKFEGILPGSIRYSPDSKRMACVASTGSDALVMIDGDDSRGRFAGFVGDNPLNCDSAWRAPRHSVSTY